MGFSFDHSRIRSFTAPVLATAFVLAIPSVIPGASPTAAAQVSGTTIYALTTSNRLATFSSDDPCTILAYQRVNGLAEEEDLLGIDVRPATGELYGLGSSSRIYVIDPATGEATAVGDGPFTPTLQGSAFGFDFNPTVDRIRVVSDSGQNLRIHPDTGAVAVTDTNLTYATTDLNAGAEPVAVGAAYTNPDTDPATGTTLHDIDAALDTVATQAPPNAGTLNTVGSLGLNTNDLAGFDIGLDGTAYAALKTNRSPGPSCGNSTLVTIDLATGSTTVIGRIGTNQPVRGLAVALP